MKHLSSLQLCAFLDDVLVGAPDDETARHLAGCAICRTRFESWCHVDDSLRELLGQDPDEHAMEQRTAWVQVAVSAERKGFPAPEFSELRIPMPPPTPSTPPVQLFPPGRGPVASAPRMPAPPAPVAPARPTPAVRPGAPQPREPLQRPVLKSPVLQPPASAPRMATSGTPAQTFETNMTRLPVLEPAPITTPLVRADASAAAAASRAPGYARMPSAPRKGLAAFFFKPAVWLALAAAAALFAAVPLGVAKFGIPEIKFGFHPAHEREADVKKAAADATTDREDDAEPARPKKSGVHASVKPADPDASVLFDLPALEPEDGEPDPATNEPEPKHSTQAAGHESSSHGGPQLCGEVRNTQGQPIEGARVFLTSPARMTRTDREGRFCLVCPSGKRTIRIEATGRATVTRTVQLGSKRLETRFTLDAAN